MKVLLLQLDGKLPNIALMRIAAHHRALGHEVELRKPGKGPKRAQRAMVERGLFDGHDLVYASLIFAKTRPLAERLRQVEPRAIIGGTGWDLTTTLEQYGIDTPAQDYSIYPDYQRSIGFLQRGCRLGCKFCVVPRKEGKARAVSEVYRLWRGGDYPRELVIFDNDFFGVPEWRTHVRELREGGFKTCINQGFNVRLFDDEQAAAIASLDYRAEDMKTKRVYTAWDNLKDEHRLFAGLELLTKHGIKPDEIMVYMLVGYWAGETHEYREERRLKLRAFGARPYPMAYVPTTELLNYQRWVMGAYDKTIWASARASYVRRSWSTMASATACASGGGIAWPSCDQRIFLLLPWNTHDSGKPCRMVAAFSERRTAPVMVMIE